MSKRVRDRENRFRDKTIAFRMSDEEAEWLDQNVSLSGLSKQDYIIHCLENREYIIEGNSTRTLKALISSLKYFEKLLEEKLKFENFTVYDLDYLESTIKVIQALKHKKTVQVKTEMEPHQ